MLNSMETRISSRCVGHLAHVQTLPLLKCVHIHVLLQ